MLRLFPLVLLLAACGGEPALRFATPAVSPAERIATSFPSVEVRDVSLPTYAQAEEIAVQGADGSITLSDAFLWADDPSRAVTLELSRNLATLTGNPTAPEPWPFEAYPAARVEVRVEQMLASQAGQFRLSGQYFVVDMESRGRDRAALFDLSAPLDPEAGPNAIAAARAAVVAELAELIAREGLR